MTVINAIERNGFLPEHPLNSYGSRDLINEDDERIQDKQYTI